ncbi:hypothetical protein, partial [Rhodococcus sp. AW25M09]|uniref:hypothetical protein n=1 Tax=Rhodococcus sp. AW25M09 TaxID=1268303 RepID=UPI0005B3D9DE
GAGLLSMRSGRDGLSRFVRVEVVVDSLHSLLIEQVRRRAFPNTGIDIYDCAPPLITIGRLRPEHGFRFHLHHLPSVNSSDSLVHVRDQVD